MNQFNELVTDQMDDPLWPRLKVALGGIHIASQVYTNKRSFFGFQWKSCPHADDAQDTQSCSDPVSNMRHICPNISAETCDSAVAPKQYSVYSGEGKGNFGAPNLNKASSQSRKIQGIGNSREDR